MLTPDVQVPSNHSLLGTVGGWLGGAGAAATGAAAAMAGAADRTAEGIREAAIL